MFLGLLPSGVEEQVAMQSADSNSKLAGEYRPPSLMVTVCMPSLTLQHDVCPLLTAGAVFLTVVFASLTFVIGFTLFTICTPGILHYRSFPRPESSKCRQKTAAAYYIITTQRVIYSLTHSFIHSFIEIVLTIHRVNTPSNTKSEQTF